TREKWDLGGFQAIQHDVVSLPGLSLGRLLKNLDLQDAKLVPFAKRLIEWDGKLALDSEAGPLYAVWLKALQDAFHELHVPKELRAKFGTLSGLPVMLAALENADTKWFGREAKAARDRMLRTTFAAAVEKVNALPAGLRQRWGELHTV